MDFWLFVFEEGVTGEGWTWEECELSKIRAHDVRFQKKSLIINYFFKMKKSSVGK